MRVLIAPDSFAGTLGASQVAAAIAEGWQQAAPHDLVANCPLSDGGPGFRDVIAAALGGELVPVVVDGPLGDPTPAAVLVVDGPTPTAYVEVAQAAGLHLLAPERRDPTRTSSYGAGQLLLAALATGARRVVAGVGGTATNDGGAGLLAALGAGPVTQLAAGGAALAGVGPDDLRGLAAARARLAGIELVLASASDVPLLGFHGASASYAQDKGATPDQAQALEAALGHFAHLATAALGSARPLGGSGPAALAGAGAGGGIGFALLLLGASRVGGVRAVADLVGLADRVAAADLAITGEARFDWDSLTGGVVAEVAARSLEVGVPVVVLAGQVLVGRRESMTLGVAGSYAVAERPQDLPSFAAAPAAGLSARAARVARTWSRP